MHTIVYISNAINLLKEKKLDELFLQSLKNNTSKDITGILLYKEGTFIQILEGKELVVKQLFENISKDSRHNHLTKILDRGIQKRLFNDYKTGFSTLNNNEQVDELEMYLKNKDGTSHSHAVLALLSPFLNERYV